MTRRFTDSVSKIVKGLSCPNCHATNTMITSGHAMGREWKIFKRYNCVKCKINTIHPVGIKNIKPVKR